MFLEYRWLNFIIIYYCWTPQINVSFIIFSLKCTNGTKKYEKITYFPLLLHLFVFYQSEYIYEI